MISRFRRFLQAAHHHGRSDLLQLSSGQRHGVLVFQKGQPCSLVLFFAKHRHVDARADKHKFALNPHVLVFACTRVLKRCEHGERLHLHQGERGILTAMRLRSSAPGEAILGFRLERPGPWAPPLGIEGCGRFCSRGRSPSPALLARALSPKVPAERVRATPLLRGVRRPRL